MVCFGASNIEKTMHFPKRSLPNFNLGWEGDSLSAYMLCGCGSLQNEINESERKFPCLNLFGSCPKAGFVRSS